MRQELIDFAGRQFDPLVVEAFLRIPPEDWHGIRAASARLVPSGLD